MSEDRDYLGLVGALLTAVVHLLTVDTAVHGVFIVVAVVGWIAFVVVRLRQDREVLRRWGFGRQGLAETGRRVAVLMLVVGAAFAAWATSRDQLVFPLTTLVLLLLYPLWGLVQQFLVQGLVVNTLRSVPPFADHAWLTVLAGAAAFGLVHVPDWPLTGATFGLGLLFVPLYLRFRNLWFLGLAHGWLGTLFYLWVLGRDPWVESFG